MTIEERIKQVDAVLESATASLIRYSAVDEELAHQICDHFDLQLGTLVRRAAAIQIIGDADSVADQLREAAQHLICR
jgi:hypothetical protein